MATQLHTQSPISHSSSHISQRGETHTPYPHSQISNSSHSATYPRLSRQSIRSFMNLEPVSFDMMSSRITANTTADNHPPITRTNSQKSTSSQSSGIVFDSHVSSSRPCSRTSTYTSSSDHEYENKPTGLSHTDIEYKRKLCQSLGIKLDNDNYCIYGIKYWAGKSVSVKNAAKLLSLIETTSKGKLELVKTIENSNCANTNRFSNSPVDSDSDFVSDEENSLNNQNNNRVLNRTNSRLGELFRSGSFQFNDFIQSVVLRRQRPQSTGFEKARQSDQEYLQNQKNAMATQSNQLNSVESRKVLTRSASTKSTNNLNRPIVPQRSFSLNLNCLEAGIDKNEKQDSPVTPTRGLSHKYCDKNNLYCHTHGVFTSKRQKKSNLDCEEASLPDCMKNNDEGLVNLPNSQDSFKYENIAFSGGGVRGYAYIGSIKALEDAGMTSQLKRYAGASAGAMCAAVLSMGYTADDIAKIFYIDLVESFQDQQCAPLFCIPKMISSYGVHPAKKFYNGLGQIISQRTGNPDITFKQFYESYGKELCIVVCNLSKMSAEYCHHTTTPDLPIRMAVRMSMSMPLMFEPAKVPDEDGVPQLYIDGCLGDHFPVHCFDGEKVGANHRGIFNDKTIGCYVVSERDADHVLWRSAFGKDIPTLPTYLPNTRIAKSQLKDEIKRRKKEKKSFCTKEFIANLRDIHGSVEQLRHYEASNKSFVAPNNILEVLVTNLETLLHTQVMLSLQPIDELRTVPINCGYIKSHDYNIEPADREFMIRQGYDGMKAFLKKRDVWLPLLRRRRQSQV